MRKKTLACTTECDWSIHLALLADIDCGESFQKHLKNLKIVKMWVSPLTVHDTMDTILTDHADAALIM